MFKAARWRSEKNKIKAVFKLQFVATQVSKSNGDGLTISVVPGDVGKPTVKLEKAKVQEGCCRWENPVYEPVKFVKESKSGKINQKIYHFIVSTGVAKGGLIGEASVDFADYVETFKASTLSLPLKNSSSKAVLHVTLQRVQENADQREVEEIEDVRLDRSLKAHFSYVDAEERVMNGVTDDGPFNETSDKVELSLNGKVSSASDITTLGSDDSSGLDTPVELGVRSSNVHQDHEAQVPHQPASDVSNTPYEEYHRFQWELLAGPDNGTSADEFTNSSQDTSPGERSEHASDNEMEKLKAELVALTRQVDVSEMELQTLRKQIVKESKRGQELSQELVSLKDERDALKLECEKLKAFQKRLDDAKAKDRLQLERGDPFVILEEIRQELSYEKDLNANLRLQLQKTQESNAELILVVQDLEEMLNKKDEKILNQDNAEELTISRSDTDEDEEQKALEELVKGGRDPEETYLLEQTILDLRNQMEIYKKDKDVLEMQIEQLALDYEILKQANHDMSYKLEQSELQNQLVMQCECSSSLNELEKQIESLETKLKKQSEELSNSLATIKELEAFVKSLEEELEAQAQVFESDLGSVTCAKVEQEKRAIRAEEALRLTKWKNANTAERLQEEFKKLSVQMASTFDANEKLTKKAVNEAAVLRREKSQLKELLKKPHEELQSVRKEYEEKIVELFRQVDSKTNNERNELVITIALLKKEIEKSLEESQRMKHLKDEKETAVNVVKSEMDLLKAQCNKLKHSLSEDEAEKEKLTKQIVHLKCELKKKEDSLTTMEKRLKDNSGRAKPALKNNKATGAAPPGSKEVQSLRDKIKLLEEQIKKKETAMEASTNSFLEKEKELQKKIDGLETRALEQKIAKDTTEVVSNGDPPQEIVTLAECLSSLKRNGAILSQEVLKASNVYNEEFNHGEILAEFGSLKERNKSLECELNEMQERYSEISLKFAEVEGERQQLVMTVRNLKNVKKS